MKEHIAFLEERETHLNTLYTEYEAKICDSEKQINYLLEQNHLLVRKLENTPMDFSVVKNVIIKL